MIQAPRLWDVVEEHLDDAGFLLDQWENALTSAVQRPREIARFLEPRIRANLDGLHLACPDAVDRLLLPALHSRERGRALAAALVLAERPGGLGHLVEALCGEVPHAGVIGRALGLAARPELAGELVPLLRRGEPPVVSAVLDALAFRQIDPGPVLLDHLRSRDPRLAAAALRACVASSQAVRPAIEVACASPQPAVRDAAIAAGLRFGSRVAYVACERLLLSRAAAPAFLHQVLAIGGVPSAVATLEAALEPPETRSSALRALGCAGWPSSVDRILECADDPALAPLAGEAFSGITGIAVEGPFLAQEETAEPPDFEEDDLDAELGHQPEGELPRPAPSALRAWWEVNARRFDPSLRHLDGAPWSPERQHEVFLDAAARRRQLLGFELAVRTRWTWHVEVRGWASAQLASERVPPRLAAEARHPFTRLLQG